MNSSARIHGADGLHDDAYRHGGAPNALSLPISFDHRWFGDHGIGRFARSVFSRMHASSTEGLISGKPSSPVDPLRLLALLSRLPSNALFYSPGYNAPIAPLRRYVVTIHDLIHIEFAGGTSSLKRLYYSQHLRRACHRAVFVATVSEFSKAKICDWAGLAPDRVINVGNGVDEIYGIDGPRHDEGVPYLLCVSNRRPHKNEGRLLEAFAAARIDPSFRLVLTGNATQDLGALIDRLGIRQRVRFAGRVGEVDLPALYRGASALLFPSLYEGFGLPVIEAMACGTPVVTSSIASLPEVAGDAALLVDPLRVDEIAHVIETIVIDDELRSSLSRKGRERVERFTWDGVASRLSEALLRVA